MKDPYQDVHFPSAGMDLTRAFWDQKPRPMSDGAYARTCRLGRNVRSYEPAGGRNRGGSRPGLSKYLAAAPVAGWLVQELATLVWSGGTSVQQNASGRVVTLCAVSQGNLYYVNAGDTGWTLAANNTGRATPLNFTGLVRSTSLNQKLYLVDGVNAVYFDPTLGTVANWTASSGTFPADSQGNLPRLICTWRGRVVLSGILMDPQNWFMSAVATSSTAGATDFNYFTFPFVSTQAVAGNNSPLGLVGDSVTCLIPYTDDLLIVGSDHEIYMIKGDPTAGGQIDLVTKSIGMAWGNPWAMDPQGTVYFVSNRTGIYSMVPGQKPQRISQPIEQLLQPFDTGLNTIRLIWNDRHQCLHVFVSPTSAPALTSHFCWEQRSGAWWTDQFGDTDYDPLAVCVFDGNQPGDRAALVGSWDGYVRSLSSDATDDDGTAIASSVVIGPLATKDLDRLLLKSAQAVLGEDSGDVTYAVYVGATAEAALSTTPVKTGTWGAGRNLSTLVRKSGHGIYVRIDATNAWALEQIRLSVESMGKVQARGR